MASDREGERVRSGRPCRVDTGPEPTPRARPPRRAGDPVAGWRLGLALLLLGLGALALIVLAIAGHR